MVVKIDSIDNNTENFQKLLIKLLVSVKMTCVILYTSIWKA